MIDTAVVNGEYDFQIPQLTKKKNIFYVLYINNSQCNNKQRNLFLLFSCSFLNLKLSKNMPNNKNNTDSPDILAACLIFN